MPRYSDEDEDEAVSRSGSSSAQQLDAHARHDSHSSGRLRTVFAYDDSYQHPTAFPGHSPSPRDPSPDGRGGRYADGAGSGSADNTDAAHAILGDAVADGLFGKHTRPSTTEHLARRHGVKGTRMMFVDYYLPFLRWVRQYHWRFISGDLVAAFTMASFYIPMSLSYAANLGHVPPVQGMYAFVFNPLIYAFLGTCPQMVLGPEAPGSLLTGNVVIDSIRSGKAGEDEAALHARICGVVTGVAGGILLLAGFARLGFLDNVLSKPFLRGFISAIGVVIFVDQLIPELGLSHIASEDSAAKHGSTVAKLIFLIKNVHKSHALTAAVSLGSFAVIMVCRSVVRDARFPPLSTLT